MNKSEIKGLNWLISNGYSEQEIVFQARRTPDFLTSDGKGWEVKKVYGKNTFWMSISQFERIKLMKNTTIVIFNDEFDTPITTIPAENIEPNKIYNGIRFVLSKKNSNLIEITANTMHRLRIHIASENDGRTYGFIGPTTELAINRYIDWVEQVYENDKVESQYNKDHIQYPMDKNIVEMPIIKINANEDGRCYPLGLSDEDKEAYNKL